LLTISRNKIYEKHVSFSNIRKRQWTIPNLKSIASKVKSQVNNLGRHILYLCHIVLL